MSLHISLIDGLKKNGMCDANRGQALESSGVQLLCAAKQVAQCRHGMVPQHAGAGVAHHVLDALAHVGTIAVHRTFLAHWLMLAKATVVEAEMGIRQQCLTVGAQSAIRRLAVLAVAKDAHHQAYGMLLLFNVLAHGCNGEQ